MNNLKQILKLDINLKTIVKLFLLIFSGMSMLLVLSCTIVGTEVKNNIKESAYLMEKEGEYPMPYLDSPYFRLDNWTEATILNFIYSDYGNEVLKTAFAQKQNGGMYNEKAAETGLECLMAAVGDQPSDGRARSAYWIGARILLIPLLNYLNYYQIRLIFIAVGYLILFGTLVLSGKKNNMNLAIILGISLLVVNFYPAMMNISLGMFCFWISFFGIIYLLYHQNINYFYFLFVIGILTSYFEWFALSILTFGLLTIAIVIIEFQKNHQIRFGELLNIKIKCAVGWCLGFVMMYAGRVVCSSLIMGLQALEYFKERTMANTGYLVGNAEKISFLERTIQANISCIKGVFPFALFEISDKGVMMCIAAIVLIIIGLFIFKKNRRNLIGSLTLLGISPFLWISCFSSYSIVHFWIIYRVLIIAAFAFFCIIYYSLLEKEKD